MENDMIPVSKAVELSGYTRQHIHYLANVGHLKNEYFSIRCRVVSSEDLAKYVKEHKKDERPTNDGIEPAPTNATAREI